MKTRRQKVVLKYIRKYMVILSCILLCASFFVMPVSAEVDSLNSVTIENYTYIYGGNFMDSTPDVPVLLYNACFAGVTSVNNLDALNNVTSMSTFFTYPYPFSYDYGPGFHFDFYDSPGLDRFLLVYYINQLFDDNVYRTFSKDDTFYIDSHWLAFYLGSDTTISNYRFVLRDFGRLDSNGFGFGNVVAYTDIISTNINDEFPELEYDRLKFTFVDDVYSNSLCLCFEMSGTTDNNTLIIAFDAGMEFTINYGSGVSPNYPIYPDAPGGNEVNDYASKEQQLVDSQQQGLSQGANSISNTNSFLSSLNTDLKLMSFVPVLSGMLDRLATIPGVMPIVQISLALGLFASLLGMAGAIVSAADRKAAREKREAARAARSDKKK